MRSISSACIRDEGLGNDDHSRMGFSERRSAWARFPFHGARRGSGVSTLSRLSLSRASRRHPGRGVQIFDALQTGAQIGLLSGGRALDPLQYSSKTFCNHPRKGRIVTLTEHPKRPLVLAFTLVLAFFALTGTALAATLEEPKTEPASGETTTSAELHGLLNPLNAGQPGSYQFDYAPAETGGCTGYRVAPESQAPANGLKKEAEFVTVTGLEPNKEYLYCIVAYNLNSAEFFQGNAVSFKTDPAPPALTTGSEKASSVTSTGAELAAEINPNNEPTTYTFEYSTTESGGKLTGTPVKLSGGPLEGGTVQTASVPTKVLLPNTTYFYRVVANNKKSEEETKPVEGPVESFTSAPEPPTTSTPAKSITATTAELEGVLNPKADAKAGWYFAYSTGGSCTGAETSAQEPEATVTAATETKTVTKLEPSQKYTFCLVATNAAGTQTTAGNEQTLETKPAPPEIEAGSEKVSSSPPLTPFEAQLEANVNPNNQTTTYTFEYSTSPSLAGATVLKGSGPLSGYGDQTASAPSGHHLTPGTVYHYRVVAENAAHEKVVGTIEEFKTPAAALPAIESETATAITPEDATLEAQVNPEHQETTCSFQYATEAAKLGTAEGKTAPCTEPLGEGAGPVVGKATITGLALHTVYFYRVLATNATGTATDATAGQFETETTTAPAVEVESLEAKDQTETTATLTGKVNPNGAATTIKIEYDTSPYTDPGEPGHGTTVTDPTPLTGNTPAVFAIPLTGLKPDTEYHWRLTATNAAGAATPTVDQTFGYPTQPSEECPNEQLRAENNSTNLPDCRAYEQVTPKEKNGALIGAFAARPSVFTALSANGERMVTSSDQCFAEASSCTAFAGNVEGAPYEFERSPTGWKTHALAPSAAQFEYQTFLASNPEDGAALFTARASETEPETFYAEQPSGAASAIGPIGEARPASAEQSSSASLSDNGALATPNLSHIVYQTAGPIWSFGPSAAGQEPIYEYAGSATQPILVGVKGGRGSHQPTSECKPNSTLSYREGSLSSDGRTVYFDAHDGPQCSTVSLYARVDGEREDAHTVLISGPVAGGCDTEPCPENVQNPSRAGIAQFAGASTDGSHVVFTDPQQLTNGATQAGNPTARCYGDGEPGGCNLYESVCSEPCGTPSEEPNAGERELIDVSEDSNEAGGPRVQGVMVVSPDGSHIYFVAQGDLTGAEENGNHRAAASGQDNLYLYERDAAHPDGHLTFIAQLAAPENSDQWNDEEYSSSADVTSDGQFLVFRDASALTADDTRSEGPDGESAAQVYEYDATTGELIRISIGQDGWNDDGNRGTGNAFIVPSRNGEAGDVASGRLDPTMSGDGSFVFFESPIALTPGALNDQPIGKGKLAQNTYEYHAGHVYLLSDGRDTTGVNGASLGGSSGPTELVGTSETGNDVIFSTFDALVPGDTDTQRDFYDARVDGGTPVSRPLASCEGEDCQQTLGAAPVFGMPGGTATVIGQGNLPQGSVTTSPPKKAVKKVMKCKKGFVKKKNKCVKVKAKKKAKKAGTDRRVSR
jgi:hypothetical protein